MDNVAAIIVAAGRGMRAGGGIPKQYRCVDGESGAARTILGRAITAFLAAPRVGRIITVIHPDDRELYESVVASLGAIGGNRLIAPVAGAASRQGSVRAGLEALAGAPPDIVLIHDAARPFVSAALIERAMDTAALHGAAVPGLAVHDTVKEVEGAVVLRTPDRAMLRTVQTPQAFRFGLIRDAHRRAAAIDGLTDDASVAEWAGIPVVVFEGEPGNMKVTMPEDLAPPAAAVSYVTRMGIGYDVHAFGEGDHIWLGGVRVPHDRGVVAHSDGDVVLHALTDALLGAIADGDIGVHFPPSDPQWKGASSDRFLAFAAGRVRARGGIVDHLDATVICEKPRIGAHREAMRAAIAAACGIDAGSVSVKATTSERLGFTGRAEGLAAQAVATVRLPASPSTPPGA